MNYIKLFCCLFIMFLYTAVLHAQDGHWNVNIHDYQYDMTIYAQILDDNSAVSDYSNLEVAAFVGDECRGVATVQTAEKDGETYRWLYIRVRSNIASGEEISFRVYDKTLDKVLKLTEKTTFEAQGSAGLPSSPVSLSIVRFTLGDVNEDDEIDGADVVSLINFILGNRATGFNESAADVNEDDEIDGADVVTLINMILN